MHIMRSADSYGRLALTKREENRELSQTNIAEGLRRNSSKCRVDIRCECRDIFHTEKFPSVCSALVKLAVISKYAVYVYIHELVM